jgi:hypothetical protein
VVDWWRYLDEIAEVSAAMEVIVDLNTFDGGRMTREEQILRRLVEPDERDRFHRALLGHL